ncbi:MAG: CarD family transcriptional regulator [Hyphomicrobiaceae bacterium]
MAPNKLKSAKKDVSKAASAKKPAAKVAKPATAKSTEKGKARSVTSTQKAKTTKSTKAPAATVAKSAKAAPSAKLPKASATAAATKAKAAPAHVSAKVPAKAAAAKVAAAAPVAAPQRAMPAAVAKPTQPKLVAPAAPKPAPAAKAAVAAPAADAEAKKAVSSRHGFKTNEFIVYPAHGVGRIIGIEEQEIAGISLELFVIQFEKDKMTLRVPTSKLQSVGMRKLAEDGIVKKAMDTLKGKARIKRTMWSRRAQEYEAKINSGDLIAIAEVVRDLYRSEAQPEQSYSERQLYEAALDRMAREIAAVDKVDERGAVQRITEVLAKSAKGRRAAEEETDGDSDAEMQAA